MGSWFQRNRHRYPADWDRIAARIKDAAGRKCEACGSASVPGRILTVDHLDHDPSNCVDDNLMALCQRCHLRRQGMMPMPRTKDEAVRRLRERHTVEAGQGRLFDD